MIIFRDFAASVAFSRLNLINLDRVGTSILDDNELRYKHCINCVREGGGRLLWPTSVLVLRLRIWKSITRHDLWWHGGEVAVLRLKE